jgi:hypothetical protein
VKYYLILGFLILSILGIVADSTRGNDPRWVRNDNCIEGKVYHPCFVYRVSLKENIAQFIFSGQSAIFSHGFVKPGSAIIYSPVFPQGPVYTRILVKEKPDQSPGDFTEFVVRKDSMPRLPQ